MPEPRRVSDLSEILDGSDPAIAAVIVTGRQLVEDATVGLVMAFPELPMRTIADRALGVLCDLNARSLAAGLAVAEAMIEGKGR